MDILLLILLSIPLVLLLIIQYTMVISDWKNRNSKIWEKIIGTIPFGPYILMLFAGIWHLIRKILK